MLCFFLRLQSPRASSRVSFSRSFSVWRPPFFSSHFFLGAQLFRSLSLSVTSHTDKREVFFVVGFIILPTTTTTLIWGRRKIINISPKGS